MHWDASASASVAGKAPTVLRGTGALAAQQQRLVKSADTFFTASSYGFPGAAQSTGGCDASHRGGPRGFVQVRNHLGSPFLYRSL